MFPGPESTPQPFPARHAAPARPVFPGPGTLPPVPNTDARPVFPGKNTPLPQPTTRTEPETPPRGTPRGWFDELPEQQEEAQDFGPTGQPTEIPYKYKR